MVSLHDYHGREQTYVKHIFLEGYLESLVHKVASRYPHIVYVDGFAGPWQSANEKFEDTSFGIALAALRQAKASWKARQRDVQMSAFLVERNASAYRQLAELPIHYPDIKIHTLHDDFLAVVPKILESIPANAFAFFLIDPKGWRIRLRSLEPLLSRQKSEVIFNFMFDFINRAASISDPVVVAGLDELIPYGDWRNRLEEAERSGHASAIERKLILVYAFAQSLKQLGGYEYVAETTVLRPLSDRPLYCLVYATRHATGIEVFRDSQISALREQSKTRATTKVSRTASASGQGEFFESLHEMAPNELESYFQSQLSDAESSLLELAPMTPNYLPYRSLWPQVLSRHVVKRSDVNKIAARLRRDGLLVFPDWEPRKLVPQPHYRVGRS